MNNSNSYKGTSAVALFWVMLGCNFGLLLTGLFAYIVNNVRAYNSYAATLPWIMASLLFLTATVCAIVFLSLNRKTKRPNRSTAMIAVTWVLILIDVAIPVAFVAFIALIILALSGM